MFDAKRILAAERMGFVKNDIFNSKSLCIQISNPLGAEFAGLGNILGRSWEHPRASLAILEYLGGVLGASWEHLEATWVILGRFGANFEHLGGVLGQLGAKKVPKTFLAKSGSLTRSSLLTLNKETLMLNKESLNKEFPC